MESNAQFRDCKQIYSLLETLNQQRISSKLCDVIIKISDEQIYAHSNILASASPYFDTVFSGQDLPRAFSQKMPQVIEIHIDGSTDPRYVTAVEKVLDFMYTSRIHLDSNIITQVLEIAKIMEMHNIIEFCHLFALGCPYLKEEREFSKVTRDTETQTMSNSNEKELVVYNGNKYFDKWTFKTNLKPKPKILSIANGKRKRGRPRKKPIEETVTGSTENTPVNTGYEVVPLETNSSGKENMDTNEECNANEECSVNEQCSANEECSNREKVEENVIQKAVKKPLVRVSKHGRVIKPKKFFKDMVSFVKEEVDSDGELDVDGYSKDNAIKTESDSLGSDTVKTDFEAIKRYVCEECEFSTSRMKEFAEHHKEHLHAEKKCSYCGWVCENPDVTDEEFREHLNNHKGSKPFFCNFCSQRFETKAKLYQHLPKHSKSRPFVCEICLAGFKWKQALKSHMTVHKTSKEYLCDICGFSTSYKTQLKAHHLIHTGDTFKCEEPGCDYQSTKRSNLKFHMMTHSREKPHQCELCGQAFSLVKNMKRHMLLHTSERRYKCQICSFCTTRFDKLKEHYFKQHQIGEKPKKKLRISEYLKHQRLVEDIDDAGVEQIETNVLDLGEDMQTIELQVAEGTGSLMTTQIVNVTSTTGEAIPIAISQTETNGEVAYEIQHFPVQITTQEVVAQEVDAAAIVDETCMDT